MNFIKADDRADTALALPLPDAGGEGGAEAPHAATDQQIETAMNGNVCRCGTYMRIKEAIHLAANGGRRA